MATQQPSEVIVVSVDTDGIDRFEWWSVYDASFFTEAEAIADFLDDYSDNGYSRSQIEAITTRPINR